MIINVCNHDCTELWNQVLYKRLSNYPNISDWKMKNIIDFINYEKSNGRSVDIKSDSPEIVKKINDNLKRKELYENVIRPRKITECTACPYRKGCMTEFVCHTSPIENAKMIFSSGKLLSAVNARGMPAEILMKEDRNAANDPIDFFKYVMLAWGNCQAGDRLVMERKMKRMPTKEDLGENFTPGIRFYFKYDTLDKHPKATHDGFLPIKILDEIILEEWLYAAIIPMEYKEEFETLVPDNLKSRIYYPELFINFS